METTNTKADQLLKHLGSLPLLNVSDATSRLYAAFRETSAMSELKPFFQDAPNHSSSPLFDGVDRKDKITTLGNAAIAYVLTKLADRSKFHETVKKDEALKVPTDVLNTLANSVFADHISGHLVSNKFETLAQLRNDKSVAINFHTLVTSRFFDPFGGRQDLSYSMTLLFVYEYLVNGPDFHDEDNPQKKASLLILEQWQSNFSVSSATDEDSAKLALAKYAFVAGAAFSPNRKASDTVLDVLQSLMTVPAFQLTQKAGTLAILNNAPHASSIESQIKRGSIFDDRILDAYQTQTRRIWRAWMEIMDDETSGLWIVGLRKAQAKQNIREWTEMIRTPEIEFSAETGYREVTEAPELAAWYRTHQKEAFMNEGIALENVRTNIVTPEPPFGSCFIAGTVVRTSTGDKEIQNLNENDLVCTRLQPVQWGVRSCEVVQNPSPVFIYGFNDEQNFFTAGHVFHTTTGLRAVQPEIARRENPWIEVGQLAVGHQLLRMTSNDTYEPVEIHSINSEVSQHKYVYGVHLREGLRSYHANGYLVALNYPEITVSMVAKRLMSLPPQIRLKVLNSVYEIRPILQEFGAATVFDVLSLESQSNSHIFGGRVEADRQFLARDVNMPYVIKYKDRSGYGEQLELKQGLLYIEGKLCQRVAFKGKSLMWSRQVSDDEWEHAHCEFTHNGIRASGYLARSSETSTEKDVEATARAFQLVPGTIATMRYQTTRVDGDTFSANNNQSGADTNSRSENSSSNMVQAVAAQSQFQGDMATLEADPAMKPAVFTLVYDPRTYLSHEKTPPNATLPCGTITLPPDPDDDDEYSWPMLQIDQYETVRRALVTKIKSEEGVAPSFDLPSLYTHNITYDARETASHEFNLTHVECLVETSDEYKAWAPANYEDLGNSPPTKNLHYTNLGLPSDFVVTEIFQSITLEQGAPDSNNMIFLSGVARSYSPTSEGYEGPAHWMVGSYKDESTSDVGASNQFLQLASNTSVAVPTLNADPHAFASLLAKINADDLNTIVNELAASVYDQKKINDSSQITMTNVMLWHMKEEDRKLFFGTADQPSGLPANLTTQLVGSAEAAWIRDVYANAYICQILAKNDSNLRDKYKFTKQEKKNIEYFWQGRGKKCLSQSQIHKNLERTISRYQIRVDNEKVGKLYSQNRGQEISTHIYTYFTSPLQVGRLRDKNAKTGTALLTKLCAIADALDDGKTVERKVKVGAGIIDLNETNGNSLLLYAISYFKGELWQQRFVGGSHEDRERMLEEEWFTNVLRDIITMILQNDPKITGDVANEIRKRITENASQVKDWNDMAVKYQVELLLKQFSGYVTAYMKAFDRAAGWVKKAGKWVWAGIKRKWANWRGNSGRVADAADKAVEETKPTGFLKGPVLKSLMVMAGLCVVGLTIWSLGKGWENYSVADRGRMIVTVFAGLKQVAEFSIDAVFAILRYSKKGSFSEAMEIGFHARFDFKLEKEVGQNWNSLIEGKNGKYRLAALENHGPFFGRAIENEANGLRFAEKYGEITDEMAVNRLGKMSEISNRFKIAQKVVAFFGYIISIAFAIFLTWQLIKDWGTMDVPTKIFELIQVILSCIEGIFAAVIVVGYIAWGIALALGSATAAAIGTAVVAMATIFASVTVVLAVIALFVLIAFFVYSLYKQPPPNPVEQYVVDTGRDFAAAHEAAEQPIEVTISPTSYPNDDRLQTVTVSFVNKSKEEQWVFETTFEFASGAHDGALFRDKMDFKLGNSFEAGNAQLVQTSNRVEMSIVNFPHTVLKDAIQSRCRISANSEASISSSTESVEFGGARDLTNSSEKAGTFSESLPELPDQSVITVAVAEAAQQPPEKEFDGFKLKPNEQIHINLYGKVYSDKHSECSSVWTYRTVEDVWRGEVKISRGLPSFPGIGFINPPV